MSSANIQPGDIIADKYRVDRVLGAGGMGVVVAATHLDLLEPRALKFMSLTVAGEAEAGPRFLREARAAARLKSEHIVKVYDVGKLDTGLPYMVMEYLEGSDLDALLKLQGPLPPPVAALYGLQVCSALAEAHAAGIVHRDLKPANLFLTHRTDGSPCVKVLDFGISKITTPGMEGVVTKTQEILGSPFYMSPEQMRSTRNVDARTDIWSLGIILYKMVTGRVPFQTKNITELVSLVLEAAPTPPSLLGIALPPGFEGVILRCLRRKPEERYQNVVELAGDLARFGPPGAGALVEAMGRVFAAAAPGARAGSSSALIERPSTGATAFEGNPSGEQPPMAIPVSAMTSAGSGGEGAGAARPMMRALPAGEPTVASWGKTSTRTKSRSATGAVLGVGGAVVLLCAVIVGALLLKGAKSEEGNRLAADGVASATVRAIVETAAPQVETAAVPVVVPSVASSAAVVVAANPVDSSSAGAQPVGAVPAVSAVSSATAVKEGAVKAAGAGKSAPGAGRKTVPTGTNVLGAPPIF